MTTQRVQRKHKPTNPHWGRPMPLAEMYGEQNVCEFEGSQVLRDWVKRHYRQRYVPEYLLVLWDLIPSFEE
jgi:hypothetical protein